MKDCLIKENICSACGRFGLGVPAIGCASQKEPGMNSKERLYELAVHTHRSDLYRYAFWLCRHEDRAEDLVQETFLRAWRYWGKLEDVQAVKAWLFSILRREHLRDLPKTRLLELEVSGGDEALRQLVDQSVDIADDLTMRQMLMRAPVALREALVLQVLGGFSTSVSRAELDSLCNSK